MIDKREGFKYTTPIGTGPYFHQIDDYMDHLVEKRRELLESQKLAPKASHPNGATES